MSDANGSITLAEFAAAPRQRRRLPRWSDCLPDSVVEQVMASTEDASAVANWLKQVGYPDATAARVKVLIDDRYRRDAGV